MTVSKIRFIDNDYSDFATITATSSASGFPATNAANSRRSLVWKPGGNFTVTSANNTIYINDGADKVVTLSSGSYTYATLATHIQTLLNAASSGWTVAYSTTAYKFTISRSSSATLRFTQTTSAAWSMLGYLGALDITALSWLADVQRNHTEERYQWDLGVSQEPTFFAAIGPLADPFTISDSAVCKIMGNNIPSWTSPGFSLTLDVRDRGIHQFITPGSPYRYWCFEIVDRDNPLGPTGLKLGRIWLGDHETLTATNVSRGFNKSLEDNSDVLTSESGVRFYNQKTKYRRLSALEILNMPETDRLAMEAVFNRLGVDQSFFISLDPELLVTPTTDDLTIYGTFDDAPKLRHLFQAYYSMGFDFRESV